MRPRRIALAMVCCFLIGFATLSSFGRGAGGIVSHDFLTEVICVDCINAPHIGRDSVTSVEIQDKAIDYTSFSANTIQGRSLRDDSIITGKIATGGIRTQELAQDSIALSNVLTNEICTSPNGVGCPLPANTCSFLPAAHLTATTYTGNMGGYSGMNAKCSAEFPGTRVCTAFEMQRRADCGLDQIVVWGWIANLPALVDASSAHQYDCFDWLTGTNGDQGSTWGTNAIWNPLRRSSSYCDNSLAIWCCA